MTKKIIITINILFVLFSYTEVRAQFDYGFDFSKAGTAGLQFLKIGVGARETALGEAAASIVNDANAVFWNPAGIAFLERPEVQFSHNLWLVDSKHSAVAAAYPLGAFVVAVSAVTLSINEFEETTALQPDGTGRMVEAGDLMIGLSAARRFTDRLSIGMQVKYIREELDDYSLDNVLFDVGAIYNTGFRNLKLAFALQHFGPDMKLAEQGFRTPLLFRVSVSDQLFAMEQASLTAAAELVHPTDNVEWVNLGLELKLIDMVDLRGGYKFSNDIGDVTFGVGIRPPALANLNLKLDYSYVPSETVFKDIQRFTVGLAF
jgi:hypothetical protein